jgi:DUF1009 family protein
VLALIAGTGRLPRLLQDSLLSEGCDFRLCALEGDMPDVAPGVALRSFRIEHLGSLLADLKAEGVTGVALAGGVTRPRIDPTRVDAATRPLLEQLAGALRSGDDGALRVVLSLFERAGFHIVAAQDILPDLLPAAGVLTRRRPDDADGADAGRAAGVLARLGPADIGQSCVVMGGQVLAVEALPGTDWMLESLARVPSHRRPAPQPRGSGLFFKAPKPAQDRRVDLPVIGRQTVRGCAAIGLRGLVIEEGGVIVLDRDATFAAAEEADLFVWVRRHEGERP